MIKVIAYIPKPRKYSACKYELSNILRYVTEEKTVAFIPLDRANSSIIFIKKYELHTDEFAGIYNRRTSFIQLN